VFSFLFSLLVLVSPPQEQPLPDPVTFIEDFRKMLHTDRALLGQYTYTQKETETTLDSKGKTTKTEINVYQVLRGAEEWKTYRRQIAKNGVPLTEKELEKQDRAEQERVDKETRKRASQSAERRQKEKAKEEREEREAIDEVFAVYDIQLLGRETLEGISTILVTFKEKPGYKPKTRDAKILQHIAGRAWIAEDDHELAKLEAEIIDPISIGAGLLAKVQKGSKVIFERRKINNEIWLPIRVDAVLNGRLFLLKGLNLHQLTEYSDHKKYTVDTILKFDELPSEPDLP
jgi:hypothetical protein